MYQKLDHEGGGWLCDRTHTFTHLSFKTRSYFLLDYDIEYKMIIYWTTPISLLLEGGDSKAHLLNRRFSLPYCPLYSLKWRFLSENEKTIIKTYNNLIGCSCFIATISLEWLCIFFCFRLYIHIYCCICVKCIWLVLKVDILLLFQPQRFTTTNISIGNCQ